MELNLHHKLDLWKYALAYTRAHAFILCFTLLERHFHYYLKEFQYYIEALCVELFLNWKTSKFGLSDYVSKF